jgi:hypothetical protein
MRIRSVVIVILMMTLSAVALVSYSWVYGPHHSIERLISNFSSGITDTARAADGALTGEAVETDVSSRNFSLWCPLVQCPTVKVASNIPVRFQYMESLTQTTLNSYGYQIQYDDGWYLASGSKYQFRFRISPSSSGDGSVIEWVGSTRG